MRTTPARRGAKLGFSAGGTGLSSITCGVAGCLWGTLRGRRVLFSCSGVGRINPSVRIGHRVELRCKKSLKKK